MHEIGALIEPLRQARERDTLGHHRTPLAARFALAAVLVDLNDADRGHPRGSVGAAKPDADADGHRTAERDL